MPLAFDIGDFEGFIWLVIFLGGALLSLFRREAKKAQRNTPPRSSPATPAPRPQSRPAQTRPATAQAGPPTRPTMGPPPTAAPTPAQDMARQLMRRLLGEEAVPPRPKAARPTAPVPTAPRKKHHSQFSSLPSEEEVERVPVAAVTASSRGRRISPAKRRTHHPLARVLNDPRQVRQFIVMREILGRPASLKDPLQLPMDE